MPQRLSNNNATKAFINIISYNSDNGTSVSMADPGTTAYPAIFSDENPGFYQNCSSWLFETENNVCNYYAN